MEQTLPQLDKKIAFSTIVQYAGKALQLLFSMINLKLISGFLAENDYGIYAAISEYSLFFSTIANLGIFGNVVRKMADAPKDGKIFFNALVLRMVTLLFFFIGGVLFLFFSGAEKFFIYGTILYLGSLFFDNIKSICDGMLQANYMMGRATAALIAGKAVQFAGVFLLIKALGAGGVLASVGTGWGIVLCFLPFLAGSFLMVLLSFIFINGHIVWSFVLDKKMMLAFLLSSLPFGIINIINNLYFRFLPDYFANMNLDKAGFASFSVSFRIAQVLSLASTFLMFSVLPGFKNALDGGHYKRAKKLYGQIKTIILAGGILLVVAGSIASPYLIQLLSHQKYVINDFWFVLPLMLLLAAVSYGYDLVLITVFAFEKELWFLKREVMALLIGMGFFTLSFYVPDVLTRLFLIIVGAIMAESFMVASGLYEIRKNFQKIID